MKTRRRSSSAAPRAAPALHVALTGNAAAGKSSVARLFADWGATVLDADAIVHQLQRPGTPVFAAIVARFGPGLVAPDGTLDRAALRAHVLRDPAARRDLEAIVHPAVEVERRRLLRAAGGSIVVDDIPLLFEVMDPGAFDAVVLVDAPEPLRLERLERERGLPAAEAAALVAAQLPAGAKRARADFVIDNDATRDALRDAAWRVWRKLRARAPRRA
jgi:dephospho-CoA kinase